MRLDRLPGWVTDNDTSVREEVAPFVEATMAQRWEATRRCCRAAMKILAFSPVAERALLHRDPVDPGTLEALTRMRGRGDGR